MPVTASVFLGPSLVGIAAAAAGLWWLNRRSWELALACAVAADILTWSWLPWLKTAGNVVYWGAAAAIGVSLVDLARTSSFARRLCAGSVAATLVLACSTAWSISRHDTLRASATFGSVLAIVSYAVARLQSSPAHGRLVRALAPLVPAALGLTFLVIVLDHRRAVAEGGGVSGFVNGANALGLIVAVGLPFLLADRLVERRWAPLAMTMGILTFVVTLSASRTGLVAMLAAFFAFELGRRKWRRIAVGGVAALFGAWLAVAWTPAVPTLGRPLVPLVALTAPEQSPQSPASPVSPGPAQATQLLGGGRTPGQSRFGSLTGGRDEAWSQALKLLTKRPLLGSGFGTGSEIFEHDGVRGRFQDFVGAFDPHANIHQAYLQQLLELGIPGGLVFLAPFLAAAVAVLLRIRGGWRTPLEGALAATLVAALVCALFESVFVGFGAMTLLAWLGAGGTLAARGVAVRMWWRSAAASVVRSPASASREL